MSNEPQNRTEADAVIAITRAASELPEQIEIGRTPLLLMKDGRTINLERYLDRPLEIRAGVNLLGPADFVAYVRAHSGPGTHLFGDTTAKGGSFTAIIDYHLTVIEAANQDRPRWGNHVAKFTMQPTPEWLRWAEFNNAMLPQAAFAEFLEDNVGDICKPSGAELLEVALSLQAARSVNFRSGIRLANGQHQLAYQETISAQAGATGQLEIPERFTIKIAPFEGVPPVEIGARLRYRINDGKLVFIYRLDTPDRMVREQWAAAASFIETACGLKVHRGSAQIPVCQV